MIKELDNEKELIKELESSFNSVLKNINNDLSNNPFSHYLLFIDNKRILGFINYYLMYDRIEIANFNVLEECQNRHIGSKLLDFLINRYRGIIDNITLEVRIDNLKAIHLYQKMGFVKKAIRKGYYNGIDGLLMELEMK